MSKTKMSLLFKKVTKQFDVVQFDGSLKQAQAIAEIIDGCVQEQGSFSVVGDFENDWGELVEGDYFVKDEQGHYWRYDQYDFEALFDVGQMDKE